MKRRMGHRVETLAGVCLLACAMPAVAAQARVHGAAYTGKVFLGIDGDPVKLPPDPRYQSTFGLRLNRVAAGSSGDHAGLSVGDIVVSVDGSTWTNEKIRLSQSFGKAGDKARPGEVVRVLVLRGNRGQADGRARLDSIDMTLSPYPRTAPEPGGTPTNDALRPDLADSTPPYEDLCRRIVETAGFSEGCRDLLARLERAEQVPDPDRLDLVRYAHRDPFRLEAVSRELCPAPPEGHGPVQAETALSLLLARGEHALLAFSRQTEAKPPEPPVPDIPASYAGTDLSGHLDYVARVLEAAAAYHTRAFARLEDGEAAFIRAHRLGLLEGFSTYKMLSYDPDQARQAANLRLCEVLGKVDTQALLAQARLVGLLVATPFLESLQKVALASGRPPDSAQIARRNTPQGTIMVAGTGRSRHMGTEYAVLYELGGDDVYANQQGAPVWGQVPSAVVVDFGGDDAYETCEPFAQGCGDMGVGLLIDRAGNDSYIGSHFTQGVAFAGVGMLCDEAGDDTYRGLQFHQGIGHWGAAGLIDCAGNDRYEAHLAAQGTGLPGGFGLLWDIGDGNDVYYCKGDQPSCYGTKGVFEGWGQGMGIGYRPYASGGVGVLLDAGGSNRFEAGNFAQGGGYFYGFGLLYAAGPDNDHYIGSRYAQGFGCHQAAGALIEEGGDDRYSTRFCVAQGLSWDEAVGLFLDQSGNDRYEGGGFSHGASAMNGWTVFLDLDGQDTYLYTDQARNGGNSYHGGTSLSFFVDAGGGDDHYPSRPNNRIVTSGEHSVFVDLPGKLDTPLGDDALRKLIEK